MEAHLRRCAECRAEYGRLEGAVAAEQHHGSCRCAAPPQHEILRWVLAGMREWEIRAAACPHRSTDAVMRRVSAPAALYLGALAAAEILRPVSGHGENLLSGIEPVLALFLGAKAASSLVTSIVDSAIVRS